LKMKLGVCILNSQRYRMKPQMSVAVMKRNQTIKTIVAIGFLSLLVVTAAGSVGAFPSQTNECGTSGCHDTAGVLTLSSNSTSFSATTGVPFVLVIQAGNGAEWIKVEPGWEDNAHFSISQNAIEDGSVNDTDAATGAISVELTFIPLSAGAQTIRIWTAAQNDLATSLDITVTVTGDSITTTTPPPTVDLVGTWRMLMIILPVSVGVILLILGIALLKRKA
jgi:hypothetical protein